MNNDLNTSQRRPRIRLKITTRIMLAMAGLSIVCLVLFGYIALTNMTSMADYASSDMNALGQRAADNSTKALEALGQRLIEEKARDVAGQAAVYMAAYPTMSVADLQKSQDFQRVAVQGVGETGYTSIMDLNTGYFYFHPQERLVNTDTHVFAQTLPAVWKILEQTITTHRNASGYYDWQEADGSIRPKYMALALIDRKTADNKQLFVASTTYIDEFSSPAIEARKQIDATTSEARSYFSAQIDGIRKGFSAVLVALILVAFGVSIILSRTITTPITALTRSARSIERGQTLDGKRLVNVMASGDELAGLARVFTQMAGALEQRRADERREAEAKFQRLFDGVPVGLYQTKTTGEFQAVNPSLAELLGYPTIESLVASKSSDTYVNPEDRDMWRTRLEQEGTVTGFEFQLRRTDGAIIWVRNSASVVKDGSGNILYYEGAIEDITQRKLAEEKLRETITELEHQYRAAELARGETRAILDSASDAMMLVSPDGQVLSVNQRFGILFSDGRPVEIAGQRVDDLQRNMEKTFSDPAALRDLVMNSMHDRDREFTQVVSQSWPQPRELQLFSTPVVSSEADHLGRLYVFRDVTREREVDRMKSEFVSLVSHELRTPLTSIKGYVDLLLDGEVGDVPQEQREFLDIVKSNADRLVALINDLLDISRIESGRVELKRTSLELGRLIQGVANLLKPQIEGKGQHLTINIPDSMPRVSGDADRVTQIVTNLVSNAYKYTPAGGDVEVSLLNEGDWVRVSVRDTGIGLSAQEQNQLFTKFFRAKNRTTEEVGGTGLGLSITKSLVEMHGGKMAVTSAPGQGSTFSFTLPVILDIQPEMPERLIQIPALQAGGRILVVDDEPDIANLISRYLERGGYKVIVANNGTQAFRMAQVEQPDLITLDVKLPDVDGFTVLEWLKHEPATASIPVIMLSMLADESRGKLLGAVDFVSKPTQEKGLLERVAKAMAQGRPKVVLVADDEVDIRHLLAGYLRRAGYRVLEAGNGLEVLELVSKESPGLVLMDIRMPEMDGITALKELRANESTRDLPVVIMTASPGAIEESGTTVDALGVSGLLGKPFTAEELASAILRGLEDGVPL